MIPSTPGAAKQVFAPLLPLLLLLTTFTPLVASHAIMATPIPYASPQQKNGPIDGTTFPCHGGAGGLQPPASGYNIFPLGSKQPLKLTGTAVHGGGSCQISITYDNPPTKDSKFKVIKSIEGGCIARGATGNRDGPESAEKVNPDSYEYIIPEDIPTGNGTIAWTWFNKIGNREMYMACGPVQLTGTDKPGAKETFEKLPDIFMANIGNGCGTPDSKDVLFPNPGAYVEKANGATEAFATPTGQGCQKPTGGAGSGSGGAGGAMTSAAGGGAASATNPAAGASATGATGAGAVTTAPFPVANKTAPAVTGTGAAGAASSPVAVSVTGAPTESNTFPPGVFITKPSVDDGAPVATGAVSAPPPASSVAAPPVSSAAAPPASSVSACSAPTDAATSPSAPPAPTVPSTLLTSTISASPPPPANPPATTAAPIAGSGTSAPAGASGTLAETVPPTGDCPASQDGWYVCHLLPNSHYGTVYHRCASGKWTAAMPVPAGMQCTIKGDANGNAEARSKPEQELTLIGVDDAPIEIVPVTGTVTDLVSYQGMVVATSTGADTGAGAATGTVSLNPAMRPTASGAAPVKRAAETWSDKDENGDVIVWVLPKEGKNKNNDKPKLKLKKREEEGDQDRDLDSSSSSMTSTTTAHARDLKHDLETIASTKLLPRRDLKHDLETIASTKLLPRVALEARRKRKGRQSGTGGNHHKPHDKRGDEDENENENEIDHLQEKKEKRDEEDDEWMADYTSILCKGAEKWLWWMKWDECSKKR